MRKFITMALMAAVAVPTVAALPTAASAQSRAEIRRDRQDVRQERRELRDARRYGTRQDVRRERSDLRDARQELREDRAHRRALRSHGRYIAPQRGWNYSRIGIGFTLQPTFYAPRYYYSGYQGYGAGRFQQWVRYGDDLVLVNVRNGRVLRVVYNYFW